MQQNAQIVQLISQSNRGDVNVCYRKLEAQMNASLTEGETLQEELFL